MARSQSWGYRGFSAPNTTRYMPLGNVLPDVRSSSGTEANAEITQRTDGTYSKLYLRVFSNDLSVTTAFQFRKNRNNGNQTISVPSSTTGEFIDVSNTDTVTAGDEIDYRSTNSAGTGSFIQWSHSITFEPSDPTATVARMVGSYAPTFSAASTTYYHLLVAESSQLITTESNVKFRVGAPLTLRNLQVNVFSNARSSTTTVRLRKNGANGNQSISIGAGATGIFEDNSNTDTVVVGDDLNYSTTTGTGTGNLQIESFSLETVSTGNKYLSIAGHSAPPSFNFGATGYEPMGGSLITAVATTVNRSSDIQGASIISGLHINVNSNTVNGGSTCYFVLNAANTALSCSIPSSTSGQFIDTTNTVTVASGDSIQHVLITGGSSGSISFSNIGCVIETLSPQLFAQPMFFD